MRYLIRLCEQRAAGKSHNDPFTAIQVRDGLRRRGIATWLWIVYSLAICESEQRASAHSV